MNVLSFSILRAFEFSICTLLKKLHWFILPIILFIFFEHSETFIFIMLSPFKLQQLWTAQLDSEMFMYIAGGVAIFISFLLRVLFIQIALNLAIKDLQKSFWNQIPHFIVFIKFFFATILYYLMVTIGFILFIYPGIVLCLRLQFYEFFIVEYNAGIIEAFKASWNITQNEKLKLFFLAIIIATVTYSIVSYSSFTEEMNIYLILVLTPFIAGLLLAFEKLFRAHVYFQLKPQIVPEEDLT